MNTPVNKRDKRKPSFSVKLKKGIRKLGSQRNLSPSSDYNSNPSPRGIINPSIVPVRFSICIRKLEYDGLRTSDHVFGSWNANSCKPQSGELPVANTTSQSVASWENLVISFESFIVGDFEENVFVEELLKINFIRKPRTPKKALKKVRRSLTLKASVDDESKRSTEDDTDEIKVASEVLGEAIISLSDFLTKASSSDADTTLEHVLLTSSKESKATLYYSIKSNTLQDPLDHSSDSENEEDLKLKQILRQIDKVKEDSNNINTQIRELVKTYDRSKSEIEESNEIKLKLYEVWKYVKQKIKQERELERLLEKKFDTEKILLATKNNQLEIERELMHAEAKKAHLINLYSQSLRERNPMSKKISYKDIFMGNENKDLEEMKKAYKQVSEENKQLQEEIATYKNISPNKQVELMEKQKELIGLKDKNKEYREKNIRVRKSKNYKSNK